MELIRAKLFDDTFRECIIKGKRQEYHAMSCFDTLTKTRDSLHAAKKSYLKYDYIGSGTIVFINGIKQSGGSGKIIHFFRKKKRK